MRRTDGETGNNTVKRKMVEEKRTDMTWKRGKDRLVSADPPVSLDERVVMEMTDVDRLYRFISCRSSLTTFQSSEDQAGSVGGAYEQRTSSFKTDEGFSLFVYCLDDLKLAHIHFLPCLLACVIWETEKKVLINLLLTKNKSSELMPREREG